MLGLNKPSQRKLYVYVYPNLRPSTAPILDFKIKCHYMCMYPVIYIIIDNYKLSYLKNTVEVEIISWERYGKSIQMSVMRNCNMTRGYCI